VTGTAATPTTVNGLYTVSASHRYRRPGLYAGTVTVTANGTAPVAAAFLVRVRRGHPEH
jgi:hexosaminidase